MTSKGMKMSVVLVAIAVVGFATAYWYVWQPSAPDNAGDQSGLQLDLLSDSAKSGGMLMIPGPENTQAIVHPESKGSILIPFLKKSSEHSNSQQNELGQHWSQSDVGYRGAQACAECHQAKYDGFVHTAHFQASSIASDETILGSFANEKNTMATSLPELSYTMTKDADGFYQCVSFREQEMKFKFDIVTGKGNVGQTYLYWNDDELYQLHVSYFTGPDQWLHSPGYADDMAWYSRPVIPRCVECHATYAEPIPSTLNRYKRSSMLLGISCERCHGTGAEHIDWHRANPNEKSAKHITNPSRLAPERANDICAQCHSPTEADHEHPFTFRPGEKLADHRLAIDDGESGEGGASSGVHSFNQFSRLRMSKCFTQSESMICIDCHNPHQQERGNLNVFSKRCLKCHEPDHCGMSEKVGSGIADNCIDCHMTMEQDSQIRIQSNGNTSYAELRDHLIRVVPEATEQFMKQRRENEN